MRCAGSGSLAALLLALLAPLGLRAQPAPEPGGPFEDPVAEALYAAAVDHRLRWDDSLVEYTAVVRQRIGAGLRMPLKDRTLYREEAAHRVRWHRDGQTVIQVLALREQTPLGVTEGATSSGLFDQTYDPLNDQLFFGLVSPDEDAWEEDPDDFWFEHPLEPGYRDGYRFTSGDTLTLALPDGRRIEVIELRVVPTEVDVHRMTGSLWVEPKSGALVRAVYRLSDTFDALRDIPDLREEEDGDLRFVPGIFKPWTVELGLIAVEYGLWESDVWLPRSLRAEGVATAGILKAPAAIELAYEIESVIVEGDTASSERVRPFDGLADTVDDGVHYVVDPGWSTRRSPRGRQRVRYLVPRDQSVLLRSPELPEPIWEDAPGFVSEAELAELVGRLEELPQAPSRGTPYTLRWGLQRPDLVRYNRVEALSVGVRGQLRPGSPLGPLSLTAVGRIGLGDQRPNGRLEVTRETLRRRTRLELFHELAAVDESARHLGLGNSVTALLFGRDDGEYYRRTGAGLAWSPPAAARQSWEVRAYGEYHRPVTTYTDFSLWHLTDDAWAFRPNLAAAEGWEVGGLVRVSPWWGTDPRMAQGGVTLTLQGAGGDFEYARASLRGRAALPLGGLARLGLEAAGGYAWGSPPPQRLWILGGATTLRGYGPRAIEGPAFVSARAELARPFSFGSVSLFGDAGWAGDPNDAHIDAALHSFGVGLGILDGLIRLDAAWAMVDPTGFRLELYLDGIL